MKRVQLQTMHGSNLMSYTRLTINNVKNNFHYVVPNEPTFFVQITSSELVKVYQSGKKTRTTCKLGFVHIINSLLK